MPASDAVTGLPGDIDKFVGSTALHVPCQSLALVVAQDLAKHHATWILIIEMGGDLQAAVAQGIERQYGNVEVDEVRVIAIDGVEGAVVEVGDELLRGRTGTVQPAPLVVYFAIAPRIIAHGMILAIEMLWVESFPPFALTVGLGEIAVIEDACLRPLQIETLGWLIPCPRMIGMEGDAEGQTSLLGCTGPSFEDILLRTDAHGVPLLILRVPEVEIVVVVAEHEEILCTAALITFHECLWIPLLCLEEGQDVLEAELRGMTVMLDMPLVLTAVLHIHRTCHPVA